MTARHVPRILIVDDDTEFLASCAQQIREALAADVVVEARSAVAAERVRAESFDLLISDLRMPVLDGIGLMQLALEADADLPVLLLTGHPTVDTAVEALKLGAADYLTKPPNPDELVTVVRRLLAQRLLHSEHQLLEHQLTRSYAFGDVVGEGPAMHRVYDLVGRLAASDVDVLIVGETGTGKELVARLLHQESAAARFVPVDCGAIPEHLLESQFFGHERGAFSGATHRVTGLMEYANGGTLFLDEITSLPLTLQAKLLRALQERAFRRVGASQEITVSVRVIAAANTDPAALARAGRFREDLYYRLNVGRVDLPPLRDRTEDVPALAHYFLDRFGRGASPPVTDLSQDAMEVLTAYQWPGNVRELQNVIRRAVVVAGHKHITPADLPDEVVTGAGAAPDSGPQGFFAARGRQVAAFERGYLSELLDAAGGDVSAAARHAELPRGTMYRLMKKHGLTANTFRAGDDASHPRESAPAAPHPGDRSPGR